MEVKDYREFTTPQELLQYVEDTFNETGEPPVGLEAADDLVAIIRRMGFHGDYDVHRDLGSRKYKFEYKPHADDPEIVTATEVSTFVDQAMFNATPIEEGGTEHPIVYLISATPDPLGSVAAMMMMYEGRVITDLSQITDDERRHYFDQTFLTALDTPLEAVDLHFMVEAVTRSHTHQEVRQRVAVFAQESMRFAVKDNLRESVRPGPLIKQDKKKLERYYEAIDKVGETYHWLIANGIPAEEARGLLPHDTLTRMHHKVNLRALKQELGKRTCTQAQFDWRLWAAGVAGAIRTFHSGQYHHRLKDSNWQFQYIADSPIFKPICFQTGKCMFQASMDRGCTIRERVDREAFDEIDDAEWAADPKAGWVR